MAKGSGGGGGRAARRAFDAAFSQRKKALDEMQSLRATKPSPQARAIGRNPTPERVREYEARVKEWNRKYSAAQRQFKKFDKESNALYRPGF